MKTVYGPILPIRGGGGGEVHSVLMAILQIILLTNLRMWTEIPKMKDLAWGFMP